MSKIACLLLIGFGFLLGWFLAPNNPYSFSRSQSNPVEVQLPKILGSYPSIIDVDQKPVEELEDANRFHNTDSRHQEFRQLLERTDAIKSEFERSSDKEGFLLSVLEEIRNFPSSEGGSLLMGSMLNSLARFPDGKLGLDWLEGNRDVLRSTLGELSVANGLSAYEILINSIGDQCDIEGVDVVAHIKSLVDPPNDLLIDFAPKILASTGIWENQLIPKMAESDWVDLQAKTLEFLALRYFQNEKALTMLLDKDNLAFDNEQVLSTVISRDWFWDNSENVLNTIAAVEPGERRDHALTRVVELIAEVEPSSAIEWLELITDDVMKLEISREINAIARPPGEITKYE